MQKTHPYVRRTFIIISHNIFLGVLYVGLGDVQWRNDVAVLGTFTPADDMT